MREGANRSDSRCTSWCLCVCLDKRKRLVGRYFPGFDVDKAYGTSLFAADDLYLSSLQNPTGNDSYCFGRDISRHALVWCCHCNKLSIRALGYRAELTSLSRRICKLDGQHTSHTGLFLAGRTCFQNFNCVNACFAASAFRACKYSTPLSKQNDGSPHAQPIYN